MGLLRSLFCLRTRFLYRRDNRKKIENKPYMLLVIDEHTGEGGLNTRLEAFVIC